jgi:pentatricopeptide repeat protein
MHISPQLLSEILSGAKAVSLETKLKALHFMNTHNTDTDLDGVAQINQAVLKRFAQSGTQIKHFQCGLGLIESDGWLPGRTADPDFAENVAELIKAGRIDEARDLLNQIQKAGNVKHSTVQKTQPNPYGATRGTYRGK